MRKEKEELILYSNMMICAIRFIDYFIQYINLLRTHILIFVDEYSSDYHEKLIQRHFIWWLCYEDETRLRK